MYECCFFHLLSNSFRWGIKFWPKLLDQITQEEEKVLLFHSSNTDFQGIAFRREKTKQNKTTYFNELLFFIFNSQSRDRSWMHNDPIESVSTHKHRMFLKWKILLMLCKVLLLITRGLQGTHAGYLTLSLLKELNSIP